MIRWCAYCQHYMGEKPPFDDHAVMHGICADCEGLDTLSEREAIARTKHIIAFYEDLMEMARTGQRVAVAGVIRRGLDMGMRPVDILVGILQPTLYDIGRKWEAGEMTPAQEAAFSSFCDEVIVDLSVAQDLACTARGWTTRAFDERSPEPTHARAANGGLYVARTRSER